MIDQKLPNCPKNKENGKHFFKETATSMTGDFNPGLYFLTCIACGHRRVILNNGQLAIWNGEDWQAVDFSGVDKDDEN